MLWLVTPQRLIAAVLLLVIAVPGWAAPANQPAAAPLKLEQALPQEAFDRLGQRHGARFELKDGQAWIGPESGVRVTADLSEASFWEAVLVLAEQTGYEPVFEPYGRSDEGLPVVRLRRVNVAGEEQTQRAVAAGPLLIRSREAVVAVPLKMSQLRMIPMQTAVKVEVFLEPGVSAAYVTAAALRAVDEEGVELRRGEGFDPTVAMSAGVGEMSLHFDVIRRVPLAVGSWQALMRIVQPKGTERLRARLTVLPEEAEGSTRASTTAATQPEVPAGGAEQLGPYRMLIPPVRVGDREPAEDDGGEAGRRVATVRLSIPREELDSTSWSRLYGFLISMPPRVATEGQAEGGEGNWELTGYAVVATPSQEDPETAGVFRVWARYEAAADTGDPAWLEWELPVESEEARA